MWKCKGFNWKRCEVSVIDLTSEGWGHPEDLTRWWEPSDRWWPSFWAGCGRTGWSWKHEINDKPPKMTKSVFLCDKLRRVHPADISSTSSLLAECKLVECPFRTGITSKSYLVGDGGAEDKSEVICDTKRRKNEDMFHISPRFCSLSGFGPCCCQPCCTGADGRCWPFGEEESAPPPIRASGLTEPASSACPAGRCWCC